MNNIELSEVRIQDMFNNGEAFEWASKVYNKEELSEEQKAFSAMIDENVKAIYETSSATATTEIAQIVRKILEPEIFGVPNEILGEIFDDAGQFGEFDKMKVRYSAKNTLVARQSAQRTGNVMKSYIDFTKGQVAETSLQIETELRMSDLRRDGAYGVAQLTMFAIEEFDKQKFRYLLTVSDDLVKSGGENYFTVTGALTSAVVNDFTGYVDDNNLDSGYGKIVGLSNKMRELSRTANCSDPMLETLNNTALLPIVNGCNLVSIKKGKKTGDGQTLMPEKKLFGFAGKIGQMYTKGSMRVLTTNDNNSEVISIKFTGVEFGVCIDKPEKIAKLVIG
ncbi:hypothetical protein FDF26_16260 [Clostridium botulinum]|nr:hypothetical protein [Clostridium botulinum]